MLTKKNTENDSKMEKESSMQMHGSKSCCGGSHSANSHANEPSKNQQSNTCCSATPKQKTSASTPQSASANMNAAKTQITVKCDVGPQNSLYLRGNGAGLNWNKGVPLKNVKADEWVWETTMTFPSTVEFKVLLNDRVYEQGNNHNLNCHSNVQFKPFF